MPTNDDVVAHTSTLEEPSTPREIVVDAIALECATGSTVAQLAQRFGYSYSGMRMLTLRDEFQARVTY